MRQFLTLIFALLCFAATASVNVTMTFGYFDCYTGHKVQPTSISAQRFSETGQVEEATAVNSNDRTVSLPNGKYLLTITCIGYKTHIAKVVVAEDNATNYEFYLAPITKDIRLETETVQSKLQNGKMFLNGFVVDDNGLPVANATVTVTTKQQQTTTNAEGYFEILFPLQADEEYIDFEISKIGFTKQVYTKVLCWNKGDWSYQVKLKHGNNNSSPIIIESNTAAPHIETEEQLLNSLPDDGGFEPQSATSSCVPNSINVAFSSTGTNCCPGGGGGFPSCQTVQSFPVDVYVEHVIPNEWLASWNVLPNMIEAYKAAAIAIRSYSINRINHPVYSSWYDICSSPCCQNYGATNSTTSAGVNQTTDYVLYYNSDVPLAMYSAENNHLLPRCAGNATIINPSCTDGQTSLNGSCYSDPVSVGKQIYGHGEGMSQRGSARWASGKSLNSCSNSTSGLPNTGLATKNWTQILNQYYPPYTVYYCGNSCPQAPNDLCGNAITLTPASSCIYTDGTTCGATPINPTTGMPTCVVSPSSVSDVWYKFVATYSTATISVQSLSNFDAVVHVLSNVTCASSYTQLQCVNNTGSGGLETASLTGLTVGNTYWIRVFCNTGFTGEDFQICVTSSPTANCPDPYEPNDATGSAYNLFPSGLGSSPASTNINAYITTGADQDWFLLNISAYGTLNINLSSLPANYDLALYTGSGQLLASGINSGTTNESFSYTYTSSSGVTPPFYIKVYPYNTSQYSQCDDYVLNVSWSPFATCNTPTTPVPTSGTSSCPGTALYSTTFSIGWTNSNSNYDLVIEEYPYGSSNVVYTQNCLTTFYPQINSSNIIAGKLYRYSVRATTDCNTCNSIYSQPYYFHIAPEIYPSGVIYVCNGTGTTLSTPTITVPNGGSVSYQWYLGVSGNAQPISGANSDTYFATQSGTYFVKLTYSGSSLCGGSVTTSQSLNVYVNISTTPTAPTLSSNSPVCEGSTLTLSTPAVGGYSYHWTGPNGFSSNNNTFNIPTVNSAYAGTYSCYLVNNGCQSLTSTVNVVVNPSPTASFTYNVVGTTATFTNTSTNATSYNWNFGDSQSSTQTNPSHTYTNDNYYTVCLSANSSGCNPSTNCQQVLIGSGSSGTSSSAFANIYWEQNTLRQYIASDVVQSTVDSGYICIGAVTDTGSISNYGQYFKIDKNGNIIWARELPGNSSFVSKSIVQSQSGYLLCFNYNFNNLNVLMEIDEQGNKLWAKTYTDNNFAVIDKIFRINAGGFFAYGRAGTGYDRILMKFDNSGNIVWQTSFLYTVFTQTEISISSIIQTNDAGFVLVGDVRDNSAFPSGPTRDVILIKVNSSGTHQWTKQIGMAGSSDNGYSVYEKSNGELVVGGFSFGYGGWLLKLSSTGTSVNSNYIPATSSPLQIFQLSSGNYATMFGFRITELDTSFNVVSSKIVKAQAVVSVKKTLDDNFIIAGYYYDNPNTYNYKYNLIKDGVSINNCLDSTITLVSQTITLPSSVISPTVSTPTLAASTYSGNPYLITLVDSSFCHTCNLTASVTPNGTTTFCSGGSVTLSANTGMTSYSWSNGQTTQSINVTQAGNYSVAITDNFSCPATSQPVSVTVNPLPIADAGNNQSICNGSNAVIGTAQIQGNTYSWSPTTDLNNSQIATPTANPTTTTSYTVTVTNSFGCTSTDQTTVTVNSLPTVSAGNDVTISQGNSATIGGSPTATGNSPFSYSWSPFSDLSSAIASNPVASPLSTTTYVVAVTDNNGCINTDTIVVTVNPVGCTYTLSDSSHSYNYLGGNHIFTVTTSTSNCTWSISNSNNWFQVSPSTQQTGNGSVTITADSCSNGVPRSGTFTVAGITYTVTQTCNTGTNCNPPVADFAASQTTGNCPFTVDFFDLSQTTGTTTYTWTIYNGTGSPIISSAQNPTGILYNVLGSYLVKLDITDSCGTDTKIVANYITVNCTVGIDNIGQPTTFLVYPNPTNDVLNIVGNDLLNDNYKVSLTDVLGQLLFQEDIAITDNKIEKQIGVKQFSSGIYFLTIGSPNARQVFKINKQ